jgi:hypothetical protein
MRGDREERGSPAAPLTLPITHHSEHVSNIARGRGGEEVQALLNKGIDFRVLDSQGLCAKRKQKMTRIQEITKQKKRERGRACHASCFQVPLYSRACAK